MMISKCVSNLKKLNLISRACSSKSAGTEGIDNSTEFRIKDGLTSFLNAVKDVEEDLNKDTDDHQSQLDSNEKPKFTKLLRYSDLIERGYIKNGFVTKGVITHLMDETIYIDFGGKFPYITQRPQNNREFYVRGAEILIKILDWELTARFIGSHTDSTLCESEGRIIRLLNSPFKSPSSKVQPDDQLKNIDKVSMDEIENYLKQIDEKNKHVQEKTES